MQAWHKGNGAPVALGLTGVVASDGKVIQPDNYDQILNRTAGVLDYVQFTDEDGDTYRQTMTLANGLVVGVSRWVKQ